jgi:hypothetical protein
MMNNVRIEIEHPKSNKNEYASFLKIYFANDPSERTINCLIQNLANNGWWSHCGTLAEFGICFRSNCLIDDTKINIVKQCLHLSGHSRHNDAFYVKDIVDLNNLFDSWILI